MELTISGPHCVVDGDDAGVRGVLLAVADLQDLVGQAGVSEDGVCQARVSMMGP